MTEPVDVAQRYWATYNLGTDEYIETCTTEDLIFALDGAVTASGRAATLASARAVLRLMPDRRVEATDVLAVGNAVSAQLLVTGTFAESGPGLPPVGKSIADNYIVVLLVRGDRVAAEYAFSGAVPPGA